MKTNFGKKSLLVLIALTSILTACNNPSNDNSATESSSKPQLPDSVTGVYGANSEDCEARSGLINISSKKMSTKYGYDTVNTITLRDDGYDISTDSFGFFPLPHTKEEKITLIKEDRQFRIVPDPQGNKIEFSAENTNNGELIPRDLVRCENSLEPQAENTSS